MSPCCVKMPEYGPPSHQLRVALRIADLVPSRPRVWCRWEALTADAMPDDVAREDGGHTVVGVGKFLLCSKGIFATTDHSSVSLADHRAVHFRLLRPEKSLIRVDQGNGPIGEGSCRSLCPIVPRSRPTRKL